MERDVARLSITRKASDQRAVFSRCEHHEHTLYGHGRAVDIHRPCILEPPNKVALTVVENAFRDVGCGY